MADREAIEEAVRAHYAEAAGRAAGCGGDCSPGEQGIGAELYAGADVEGVPAAAVAASIGCANPVAVADLAEGEVVLDLGSGAGLDVLLSARRVGLTGKACGLDMTDEMLELARRHQAEAGATNVEFLKGHMEAIPLPDASVDVVLSNVIADAERSAEPPEDASATARRPPGRSTRIAFGEHSSLVHGQGDHAVQGRGLTA